jgi:hypothetical protein
MKSTDQNDKVIDLLTQELELLRKLKLIEHYQNKEERANKLNGVLPPVKRPRSSTVGFSL